MTLVNRNLSGQLERLLRHFPAVVITGVRQCGKTTLSRQCRPDWEYFDLESPDDYDRITSDPGFFFREKPANIIIDEVQQYPNLFKVLRGVIDQQRDTKGRFILTGSSSFELLKGASESLAGRVGTVELGTLKTNEIHSQPLSRFYDVFKGKIDGVQTVSFLKTLETRLLNQHFKRSLLVGGFPEPVLENDDDAYQLWMDNYFRTYINRDIRSLFPKLNTVKYRRFISMLASLSGTVMNRSDIARSVEVSEGTIREYLEIAASSYIWRNFHSYKKSVSKSIVKMPRGGMCDTGLLNYLLRVADEDALERYPYVGRLFETFVCEELIKGLSATSTTNWDYYYYRTRNGAELDLILEGRFGVLPIEIKRGIRVKRKSLSVLKRFLTDNSLPLAIIVNNGDTVELLAENIIQVPVRFI